MRPLVHATWHVPCPLVLITWEYINTVLPSASLVPAIYSMSMQSNISFSQTSNSMLQISAKAKLLWLLTVIAPNWHSIPHSWSLLPAPTVCRYSFGIKLQLSVDTVLVIEICCVCALEGVTSLWVVPSTSPQYSSVRLKHRRNLNPLSIFRFSSRACFCFLVVCWSEVARQLDHPDQVSMEASSAAHDTEVTPEELKKTRSCKWFRRGSKYASVSPAPASGVSRIQGKEKERRPSTAPIPLSTVPLVVNYFPSAVMLSRSWSFIFFVQRAVYSLSTILKGDCKCQEGLAASIEARCKVIIMAECISC
jgi:hypothetical protein